MKLFGFPHRPGLGGRRTFICGLIAAVLLLFGGVVVAQTGTSPVEPPDAVAGLDIFNERCATCHGPQALGDGELAADLPNPPAALAATETLRNLVPSEMFDTVTNGRVELGMPPFGPSSSNPLSEAERWQAIAAIYSLGTLIESVEQGQIVYEENCLACHGQTGQGDGPESAELNLSPGDLTALDYWSNISNQAVFDLLAGEGQLEGHEFTIGEENLAVEDLWSVVDYLRTFSYGYTDALAQFRPLEEASISGLVTNGTTGDAVGSEATARLRAFTQDLQPTLTLTETLDIDGRYQFDLTDVPQEWFYRVAVTYDDVEFGSDFGQLSFSEPELDLPVSVFEKTADPAAIGVEQLHLVLTFAEDRLQVGELYVVSNADPTVFVGEKGNAELGTFAIAVPAESENLSFQRGFGSMDSFIPANEIVPLDDGWADTLPVRPGPSALILLVDYDLPYEDGAIVTHPLNYDTRSVNLVIEDAGVTVGGNDGWTAGGQQSIETGQFSTYGQGSLPAGSELTITLDGKPRRTSNSPSAVIRNNSSELIIGAVAAVLVLAVAAIVIRQWRTEPVDDLSRDELLQAIADLDEEYEAGALEEQEYHLEREQLKAELAAIWEEENNMGDAD